MVTANTNINRICRTCAKIGKTCKGYSKRHAIVEKMPCWVLDPILDDGTEPLGNGDEAWNAVC